MLRVGGIGLEESAAKRFLVWPFIAGKWPEHPLLGFGITGIGFLDSQYPLVIGEVGAVGFALFVWIRWRLLAITVKTFRTAQDPLAKGLSLGFLAGFVGLLVHALAGNIFIIVRIMEPFWFVAAIVTVLPQVLVTPQPVVAGPSSSRRLLTPGASALARG
jgi:O-antigen ligase